MKTKIVSPTHKNLKRAAKIIRDGGLVIFPTETVYGIGADGLNGSACENIFRIKERPKNKPLSLHVASFGQIYQIAKVSSLSQKLFESFCPGALTIILPKKEIIPDSVTCGRPNVGIRFPANEIALKLIKYSAHPIAASSVNLSGLKAAKSIREISEELLEHVDLVLDDGECIFGISSTVIDLTTSEAKILRHGVIPNEKILKVIRNFNKNKKVTRE